MASGRKNYFRHSFTAHDDIKLKQLRDLIGIGFYFYYFTLLELCGSDSADELKDKYTFHNSTLRSLWECNLKKCDRIGTHMNAVGLIFYEKSGTTMSFRIPKLSKYLGSYSSKLDPKGPNKRKEKEIKVKEIKENQNYDSELFNTVRNKWNEIFLDKNYNLIPSRVVIESFMESSGFLHDAKKWEEMFNLAKKSEWLINKSFFNFIWVVKYSNAEKILSGAYKNNSETSNFSKPNYAGHILGTAKSCDKCTGGWILIDNQTHSCADCRPSN